MLSEIGTSKLETYYQHIWYGFIVHRICRFVPILQAWNRVGYVPSSKIASLVLFDLELYSPLGILHELVRKVELDCLIPSTIILYFNFFTFLDHGNWKFGLCIVLIWFLKNTSYYTLHLWFLWGIKWWLSLKFILCIKNMFWSRSISFLAYVLN